MILRVSILFSIVLFLASCAGNAPSAGTGSNARNAVTERARAHANLGAAYLQQNKLEIALDEFSQAIQISPDFAMAYNGLGLVRSALKQDAEAEANFEKAISLDPKGSESRNNYGTFLCSRKRYTESVEQFLEAVKNPLYKTPHLAYANAGICSSRNNDKPLAKTYLNKALEIQPLTHSAAYHLAEIQYEEKQVGLAKQTLQNALLTAPNAERLWLGVRIARVLGDRDDEASYALQLRRSYPNAKETQLLLDEGK